MKREGSHPLSGVELQAGSIELLPFALGTVPFDVEYLLQILFGGRLLALDAVERRFGIG